MEKRKNKEEYIGKENKKTGAKFRIAVVIVSA